MKLLPPSIAITAILVLCTRAYPMKVASATEAALIDNINAYLSDHPQDAQACLAYARVRMEAWAHATGPDWTMILASAGSSRELPRFGPWDTVMQHRHPWPERRNTILRQELSLNNQQPGETTPESIRSLISAGTMLRTAEKLSPQDPLVQLALACALDELGTAGRRLPQDFSWPETPNLSPTDRSAVSAAVAQLADADPARRDAGLHELERWLERGAGSYILQLPHADPEVASRLDSLAVRYWQAQALPHYRKAYEARIQADLQNPRFDELNDARIGAEAAERMYAILHAQPGLGQKGELDQVTQSLEALDKKERIGHAW